MSPCTCLDFGMFNDDAVTCADFSTRRNLHAKVSAGESMHVPGISHNHFWCFDVRRFLHAGKTSRRGKFR